MKSALEKTIMNKFDKELVAVLQNEDLDFNMERFCKSGTEEQEPSCRTALCMAGHICGTLRPAMARALLEAAPEKFTDSTYWWTDNSTVKTVDYIALANAIYKAETGENCTLDFLGIARDVYGLHGGGDAGLNRVTREQAIAHIRGRSKLWPRLGATD